MQMLDVRQVWSGIEIRLRWFSYTYVFLFGIEAVALFLLRYYGLYGTIIREYGLLMSDYAAWMEALRAGSNDPILMITLTPIIFAFVLGLYYSLGRILNSTLITAGPEEIRVTHGPVPWAKGGVIPRSDFDRFDLEEHAQRTKGGTTYYYRLVAKRDDDTRRLTVYLQDDALLRAVKEELDRFYSLALNGPAKP